MEREKCADADNKTLDDGKNFNDVVVDLWALDEA
jgi:hypothetical protein